MRQTAEAAAADRRKVPSLSLSLSPSLPPSHGHTPLLTPRSERKLKFVRRGCRRRYITFVLCGGGSFTLCHQTAQLAFVLQLRRANELGGANVERDSEIRRALGEERCVHALAAALFFFLIAAAAAFCGSSFLVFLLLLVVAGGSSLRLWL